MNWFASTQKTVKKSTTTHKSINRTLSATLIIGLMVLGLLSLRMHYQVRELKAANQQIVRHNARDASQLVHHLVQLQRNVNRQNSQYITQQADQPRYQVSRHPDWAEKMVAELCDGVCLIQGEYMFVDPGTGQPLRRPEEAIDSPVDAGVMALSATAAGPPLVVQYSGTGFLIDRRGYIATNRHVTEPWRFSNEYQAILRAGYEPQMLLFRAFFPGQTHPFDLTVKAVDEEEDIAILRSRLRDRVVPVLPCVREPDDLKVGQTVIVLGYPTGFDLLLARLKQNELDRIVGAGGATFEEVALKMAQRGLIQPTATRGMCGRVNAGRVLYDAPTAVGGSGAPVIGQAGKVVAVNTAIMKGFSGTNFGVPVSRVLELLKRTVAAEPDRL
ncbi:MAG: trypsin-like peptidase domain-containing protein [Sedimentisphaerales bacterium]|nr:trypsin-like peptidase domain-containing protein [Sedimentisphaerales bacterium]